MVARTTAINFENILRLWWICSRNCRNRGSDSTFESKKYEQFLPFMIRTCGTTTTTILTRPFCVVTQVR